MPTALSISFSLPPGNISLALWSTEACLCVLVSDIRRYIPSKLGFIMIYVVYKPLASSVPSESERLCYD